ncbi:RNA recognition motif domain-containing protein [Ditylenchus destructor]|nr:RNA recognition motif domain-containing protein [Ditylenchus destructor]
MASRSRLLQMCMRNVSISRHLCVLSSIQLSNQIPNSNWILEERRLRCFSTYREPKKFSPKKFSSKKSKFDSPNVNRNKFSSNKSNVWNTEESTVWNFSNKSDVKTTQPEDIFSQTRPNDQTRSIFVGGLSKLTTEKSLYQHFLPFGTITLCKLARNKETRASMDYGFVEFESVEQAESTSLFHPHIIDGQEVGVRLGRRKELQQKFTLFVGGLSKETTVETLRAYFSKFGDVEKCAIPRNVDNSSRGFGYVGFKSEKSMNAALDASSHCIDNKTVEVKESSVRQREFTFIVKNLSPNTTNESLHAFYSKFGSARLKSSEEAPDFVDPAFADRLNRADVLHENLLDESSNPEFGPVTDPALLIGFGRVIARLIALREANLLAEFQVSQMDIPGSDIPADESSNPELGPVTDPASSLCFVRVIYQLIALREPNLLAEFQVSQMDMILNALSELPHIIDGKIVSTREPKIDEQLSVFVAGLPPDTTDDSLFEIFSKYGEIVHSEVKRDRSTNRPLDYGFVSFETAEQAIQALNGGPYFLKGKALRVKPGKPLPLSKKTIEWES